MLIKCNFIYIHSKNDKRLDNASIEIEFQLIKNVELDYTILNVM